MNKRVLGILILILGQASSHAGQLAVGVHTDVNEKILVEALGDIVDNRIDLALARTEELIEKNPNFKLAQVMYADMLMAKAHMFGGFANSDETMSDAVSPLLDEARARWNHYTAHPHEKTIPKYLVKMNEGQENVIVVDALESRLFLFKSENGALKLVDDFYITIGKNGAIKSKQGDKRTPVGVYFVTEYLDPKTLPDYYGTGAFPLDYPNYWDRRHNRTGYGIWLHGNPLDSYSRAPRASDGCVTLNNSDLEFLKPYVDVGNTPVIIANGIEWAEPEQVSSIKNSFSSSMDKWLADWKSLDTQRYLSHYSKEFYGQGRNYKRWADIKSKINENKTFVDVSLTNMSMFMYPGEDIMLVKFYQKYQSNNYSQQGQKQQYWKNENGEWKIIYEGSI